MIIEFKLKNFNSYKNEEILKFEKKSKESRGEQFINQQNNIDTLKISGLVGVNGSGKTSLLSALNFMKEMVLNSQKHNIDTNIKYSPFISTPDKPTEFEITFFSNNKKYIYGFSYTNKKIIKEYAVVYQTQKPTEIFLRNENKTNKKFEFSNRKYEKELKILSKSVIPQTLMLSRAVQLNSATLKPIYDFFTKLFVANNLFNQPPDFSLLKDSGLKEELLDVLTYADFSIKDLELVKSVREEIEYKINNEEIIKQPTKKVPVTDLILIHKHNKADLKINFNGESSGTKKFILLFFTLFKLNKDSIILYDEIETSFNIEIVEFIINYFTKKDNKSQLLFTTHQPEILNYLRSDQINIIEKEDSVSKIINLHNIVKNNPKINKNYGDYYREGVLGGFPNVYKED